jgi:hypothetical protein
MHKGYAHATIHPHTAQVRIRYTACLKYVHRVCLLLYILYILSWTTHTRTRGSPNAHPRTARGRKQPPTPPGEWIPKTRPGRAAAVGRREMACQNMPARQGQKDQTAALSRSMGTFMCMARSGSSLLFFSFVPSYCYVGQSATFSDLM